MGDDLEDKISQLRDDGNKRNLSMELLTQEVRYLRKDLDTVQKSLDKTNESLSKILWIVGGTFITAFVSWVFFGGLTKV